MDQKETQHAINYGTYILVWLGLLVFTGLTVTVAGMNLRNLSILIPLLIASSKSGLVLFFFMHLKYERMLFKIMLFVAVVTLAIFIGFIFFDVSYR